MVAQRMRRLVPCTCALALAAAVLAALAAPAVAQSAWFDRNTRRSLQLDALVPGIENVDSEIPTWAWFLTARLPVRTHAWLVADVPYAHGHFTGLSYATGVGAAPPPNHAGTLGNPYLGLEVVPRGGDVHASLGARIPAASDANWIPLEVGRLADFDRQDAFFPHEVPIRAALDWARLPEERRGLGFDAHLAPVFRLRTRITPELDARELDLCYGGAVSYASRRARLRVALSGRWNTTDGTGNFGTDSLHQLEIGYRERRGIFRPAVLIRVPLDHELNHDLQQVVGFSIGLDLSEAG